MRVQLPGGGVRCDAPAMARLLETSLSLHSANFTLSAGHARFRCVPPYTLHPKPLTLYSRPSTLNPNT